MDVSNTSNASNINIFSGDSSLSCPDLNGKEKVKGKIENKKIVEIPSVDISSKSNTADNSSSEDSSCSYNKQSVNVKAARKFKEKRVRNKCHSCYYCQKLVVNISRHLTTKHAGELEIAKVLSLSKKTKARKNAFSDILKVGDFYHNVNVLAQKKGELILIRRPTPNELKLKSYSDYGPCPNCLGFLLK